MDKHFQMEIHEQRNYRVSVFIYTDVHEFSTMHDGSLVTFFRATGIFQTLIPNSLVPFFRENGNFAKKLIGDIFQELTESRILFRH